MSDTIAKGIIEITADASGVDASIAKAGKSIESLGRSAKNSGKDASDALGSMGKGGDKAAADVDKATKQFINSIQRATAVAKAGKSGTAEYYAEIAKMRGIGGDALKPYLEQLQKAQSENKKFSSSIASIGETSKSSSFGISSLTGNIKGLIGAYAGIAGISGFAKITDEYTKFNAQLKLATGSQVEFVKASDDVNRIATTSQASLSAISVLYARLNTSLKGIGASQEEVARVTENVSLGLKVSGATAEEAASAMLQLSQAFGSGVLRGEEFNAVNESAPILMRKLADSIGVPVGALKNLSSEGKITSDVLLKAFGSDTLLQQFRGQAKEVETISGSLVLLENTVTNIAGTFSSKTGIVNLFTTAIKDLNSTLMVLAGINKLDFKLEKFLPDYQKFRNSQDAQEKLAAASSFGGKQILPTGSKLGDAIPRIDIGNIGNVDVAYTKLQATLAAFQKVNPLKDSISKQKEYASNLKTIAELESKGLLSIQESSRYRLQMQAELSKGSKNDKEQSEYAKTIELINKKIAANGLEIDSGKNLSESEKILIDINAKRNSGLKGLTDSQYALAKAQLKRLEASELDLAITNQLNDAEDVRLKNQQSIIDSVEAQSQSLKDQIDNYSKFPSEITSVTIARLNDKKVMLESLGLVVPEIEAQIEAYKKLQAVQSQDEVYKSNQAVLKKAQDDANENFKKAQDTYLDGEKERVKEFEKSTDAINNIFREGFANMVNGGKSSWKAFTTSLVTTFKTAVADKIYKLLAEPFVIKLVASVLGIGASGVASAANQLIGADSGGIFSSIKDGLNSLNTNVVGSIENLGTFLSTGNGGLGDTIGGFLGQNASTIAGALAFSGAAFSLLKGDIKGAAFQGAGAGIGLALGGPVGGAIGSVLGGLVGSLFGGGHSYNNVNEQANYSNGIFTQGALSNNSRGAIATGALPTLNGVGQAFGDSVGALLKAFGESDAMKQSFSVKFGKQLEASFGFTLANGKGAGVGRWGTNYGDTSEAAMTAFIEEIMSKGITAAIKASNLTEGIKSLFNTATTSAQVSSLINATINLKNAQIELASRFGLTVDQAAKVSSATGLAGDDLAKFATTLASSASAFKTVGDVLVAAKAQLAGGLGGSVPDTLNAFDSALKGIDKTTQAGIDSFVKMFSLRDQFAAFTNSLDGLKGGVKGALLGIVSDSEKQAMQNADLATAFGSLGIAVPSSIQDLITLGKSIDFTSKEGLDLAAVFPSLVTAFTQTKDAVDSLMNSLRDINSFKTLADFNIYKGLATNYGNAFANSYQDGQQAASSNFTSNTPINTANVQASNNTTISTSDPNLLNAIVELKAELSALKDSMAQTVINTKTSADILKNVSPNGNAIQTEAYV